jgi:hypothetical protein
VQRELQSGVQVRLRSFTLAGSRRGRPRLYELLVERRASPRGSTPSAVRFIKSLTDKWRPMPRLHLSQEPRFTSGPPGRPCERADLSNR